MGPKALLFIVASHGQRLLNARSVALYIRHEVKLFVFQMAVLILDALAFIAS